jgi:NADH-quinone oxidoreductase subunit N
MSTIEFLYTYEFLFFINFSTIFLILIFYHKIFTDNLYTSYLCSYFLVAMTLNIFFFSQYFSSMNYVILNNIYSFGYTEFIFSFFIIFLFVIFLLIFNNEKNKFIFSNYEFFMIIIFIFFSGFIIISSYDFIFFFLCLELFSILSFTLVIKRRTSTNAEASFKYLIFASIASIILLFFIFLTFYVSGFNNVFLLFIQKIFYNNFSLILFFIIIISFIIKYGIFPFHSWVPDVYQSSSTPIFIFFNTFSKIFIIIPFIKFLINININDTIIFFVIFISFFGVLFSAVVGFQQSTFRRLIAYSSISNSSLIFLIFININKITFSAVINFTITYIFVIITIIFFITYYKRSVNESEVTYISEFHNTPEKTLLVSSIFTASIFFLTGIPPFGMFFPKTWFFQNFFLYNSNLFSLVMLIFFFTILNVFYYCRIVQYTMSFSTFNKVRIDSYFDFSNLYFSILLIIIVIFLPFYFNKFYVDFISIIFL